MSGNYRGRTGPNFHEYLNNLNTINPMYDQDQFNTDGLDLEDDLEMFTNTDFTNYDPNDVPSLPDAGSLNFDFNDDSKPNDSLSYEDVLATGTESSLDTRDSPADLPPAPTPYIPSYNAPIQPAPTVSTFPVAPRVPAALLTSPSTTTTSQAPSQKKRKTSTTTTTDTPPRQPSISLEEQTRLAAEEDKRRRNTAASARFRVKKKQREANLEKTNKELNDRNSALQSKVTQLELENKWLKDLVIERKGATTQAEVDKAFQAYRRESEERETNGRKGVGTAVSA